MIEDDLDTLPDDIKPSEVKDFDPVNRDRPPREVGFFEETEQIFEHLRSRGDQRIGQYLINAITDVTGATDKAAIESEIWNMEADRLLKIIEEYESEDDEENQTECVACGDGVDSAEQLQDLLEEKAEGE